MARIAIHMPTLSARGGAERYAAEVAAVLRDEGHTVCLAACEAPDLSAIGTYFDLDMSGVHLLRLPALGRLERMRPRRRAWQLRDALWGRQLRAWKPNVLVNAVYRSELQLPGVDHVAVCHFPHARHRDDAPSVVSRVKALVAGAGGIYPPPGATVIANSTFTAEHVDRRWGVSSAVVYPPCPLAEPRPAARERVILSVGRFTAPQPHVPNKRFDVMIEAFRSLNDLHERGYRLVLIGSAGEGDLAYVDTLRRAATGVPVDFVVNAPFARLQRAYASAELYWHAQGYGEDVEEFPEAHEHFGMTTVEAMSGGCIPLVIASAGPSEVVGPLGRGLLWASVSELAESTRRVVDMTDIDQTRLRDDVRRRAEDFSRDVFRTRLKQVLDPVLRRQ